MPTPPPIRTDPAGVQERLDRNLAEADRQSERLIASSPARQAWDWPLLIQIILTSVGTISLGVAGWWKWGGR
jgi:hypothetical protein